jgi:hypothetical protein
MLDEKQFYQTLDKKYWHTIALFDATIKKDVNKAGEYLAESKGLKDALNLFLKLGGRSYDK